MMMGNDGFVFLGPRRVLFCLAIDHWSNKNESKYDMCFDVFGLCFFWSFLIFFDGYVFGGLGLGIPMTFPRIQLGRHWQARGSPGHWISGQAEAKKYGRGRSMDWWDSEKWFTERIPPFHPKLVQTWFSCMWKTWRDWFAELMSWSNLSLVNWAPSL